MALGTTSIDGLISGLDTTSIIQSLASIRSKPIDLLTERITARSQDIQSYQALSAQVLTLLSSARTLATGAALNARSVTASDPQAVLATAGAGAAVGTYELIVDQLAQNHKVSSGAVADTSAALGVSGDFLINDQTITLSAADDLTDLRDAINSAQAGVTASIINVSSSDHRLVLRSQTSGADGAIDLDEEGGDLLETLGFLSEGVLNELQAAQDAEFRLDGVAVTRSSNSVDDLLEGVSLDLLQADPDGAITLTVSANNQAAVTAVQKVVADYNAVVSAVNKGMTWDTDTETGGVFFADASILSLQSGLHENAMRPVATLGGSLTVLSQIGITTDRNGLLVLDTAQLQEALADNPTGVMQMLTTGAETASDEVEFVSSGTSTADSGAAGYAVVVTQVATRATAQSAELATLTQDEALTINGQYTVQLTAGMTLQDAADKLNTILTGNRLPLAAGVADGRLQLQSSFYGSNYGFSIVSSLDDGAGGTDLGGTEAGDTQAYYGQNVAGTIGGKAARGWGQWLTGAEGGVQDLKLLITSATTGDKGVVKVSQGFASRLAAYAERAAGTDDSLLTRATTSITNEISDLTEEAQALQDSVNAYVEQLQLKFATMEGVLAKNKTLLSYLTTQVEGLRGLTTDQNT